MKPVRVVLDTNCLVSALVFSHGKAGELRAAWQRGDIIPVVCRESITELIRVLSYPKFRLEPEDIECLLGNILPWAETVAMENAQKDVASLRDKNDAFLINLAQDADSSFLVSGDRHLLELQSIYPSMNIVTPDEFMDIINIDN